MLSLPATAAGLQGLYLLVRSVNAGLMNKDMVLLGYASLSTLRMLASPFLIMGDHRWIQEVNRAAATSYRSKMIEPMDMAKKRYIVSLTRRFVLACGVFHILMIVAVCVILLLFTWSQKLKEKGYPPAAWYFLFEFSRLWYLATLLTTILFAITPMVEFLATVFEETKGVNYVSTGMRLILGLLCIIISGLTVAVFDL